MRDRLLIDECLSASLVAVAKAGGFVADYAAHIGMSGWQDWNLVSLALEHGHVMVTNNRRDFLREYARHDLHNGLIIVVPRADRSLQIELFALSLDKIAERGGDVMNLVIEAFDDRVEVRDWTLAKHNPREFQRRR